MAPSLAGKMRRMTGTGRVEPPPPVGCVAVDALENVLLDALVDGTEGLLLIGRRIRSPPMGSGSMLASELTALRVGRDCSKSE